MECFTHEGSKAIGICKTCGKAVCHSCVRDASIYITCSEKCEKEAFDYNEMNQRAKNIYGIGVPKKTPAGVIMYFLFAILFGGAGILQRDINGQPNWISLIFGVVFLFIALLIHKRSKENGMPY